MYLAEPYLYFANWRYDKAAGRLVLADSQQQVKLEPRLHQLLNYFLAHPMQVISKDQLMDDVWPEGEGTDAAVMRAVASLRKILQPGLTDLDSCIETLSKRGYRWTLTVETKPEVPQQQPEPVALPTEMPAAPPLLWPEARMHQINQALPQIKAPEYLYTKPARNVLPLLLASAVLVLLLFGLALFLINAGQLARLPLFSQQLNISALKGQEQSALFSDDAALLFYQYQLPGQQRWQWLRQDINTHQKALSPAAFSSMSNALWLDKTHLLFQASVDGDCYFYRQHIDLENKKPEKLQGCLSVAGKGLAKDNNNLYWLDTEPGSGVVQLWQRPLTTSGSTTAARLLYQFNAHYRRASQLHLQDENLYLIAEKDFYSNSLFQFSLNENEMQWLTDFSFAITDLSSAQQQDLLLSSKDRLLLYRITSGKVIRLPTVQGEIWQAGQIGEQLLSSYRESENTDLMALPPAQMQLSLNSSKNENLLAIKTEQLALVSERSGNQQIWWYQQGQLRQLTHLQGQRQIQQLFWLQQLYALIDLQLYLVSLEDGSLTLSDIKRPARLQACADVLYWTRWTESGWQLWRRQPGEDDLMLLPDVVDVRCGPEQQLVLQKSDSAVLQLWLPGSDKFQPIDLNVDWRKTQPEQWLTRLDALYWLAPADGSTKLFRLPWHSDKAELLTFPEGVTATALFADFNEGDLYYQSEPQKQQDIVWFMQANKTPD